MLSHSIISRDVYHHRTRVHAFTMLGQLYGFIVELIYLVTTSKALRSVNSTRWTQLLRVTWLNLNESGYWLNNSRLIYNKFCWKWWVFGKYNEFLHKGGWHSDNHIFSFLKDCSDTASYTVFWWYKILKKVPYATFSIWYGFWLQMMLKTSSSQDFWNCCSQNWIQNNHFWYNLPFEINPSK
jgi:hypothetical protein